VSKLIYITNTSLDGYIEDETGAFDWVEPDQAFFIFITDLLRPIGTYLFGRRLYETMSYWDAPTEENPPPERVEFARVWQSAEKIAFSRTLTAPTTRKTRVERDFNPEAIRTLKRDADRDILIGGAEFASVAIEASLIDEVHLFVNPIIIGGGKPAFTAGLRRELELLDTRRFDTGVIHVHYRIPGATA
jgi:dihydrofolate reductase